MPPAARGQRVDAPSRRAGQTDRDTAREAMQQLATVGARVLGTVLNDPDATLAQRKGYYEASVAGGNGRGA